MKDLTTTADKKLQLYQRTTSKNEKKRRNNKTKKIRIK